MWDVPSILKRFLKLKILLDFFSFLKYTILQFPFIYNEALKGYLRMLQNDDRDKG